MIRQKRKKVKRLDRKLKRRQANFRKWLNRHKLNTAPTTS